MLIVFTASWCKPCTELKQWLEDKDIQVTIVDIDDQPELAKEEGIKVLPTLVDYSGLLSVQYLGRETIKPFLENYVD